MPIPDGAQGLNTEEKAVKEPIDSGGVPQTIELLGWNLKVDQSKNTIDGKEHHAKPDREPRPTEIDEIMVQITPSDTAPAAFDVELAILANHPESFHMNPSARP
jgi:hypothetical protein